MTLTVVSSSFHDLSGNIELVKEIQSENELDSIVNEAGNKLVVVFFYAPWCPYCKKAKPVIESQAKEFPDVLYTRVKTTGFQKTFEKFGVTSVPTFKLIKYNKLINEEALNSKELYDLVELYRHV